MRVLKIAIIMLILIMSVGAVCAAENITDDTISDDGSDTLKATDNEVYTDNDNTFTDFSEEMETSDNVMDVTKDYTFNNETDDNTGILISKDNFIINGNNRVIDGKNQSRIFNIIGNNITINNLILMNGNAEKGGAIYTTGSLTLNNVTFIDNYASKQGAAVGLYENVTIKCDNSRFIDNYAVEKGSAIYLDKGELYLSNTNMTSKWVSKSAQITAYKNAVIYIQNAIFADTASTYSPALYIQRSKLSIINSKFYNLKADITAGAISIKECGEVYIENCEFTNITSSKNGGTINADIWGDTEVNGNVTIIDTIFKDTSSGFGGAYLQLGGNLFINNTLFTNNHATYNGGSLYLSYVTSNITNCNFTSNGVDVIEGYPTYGGAIFNDMGTLNVDKSNFINNTASAGNAICTYDSSYYIKNSLFENNTNPIYTFFDKDGVLDNNVYINDDNVSTNNELHSTIMIGEGLQLTLLNNNINVDTLPKRFDLRDWGWVSPVRDQGWMGACWTFGMTGTLESVLLKATGITTDFSENNMKDSMYRYSIYGDTNLVEGGNSVYAISYLVSWIGALAYDADVYDEMGKISPMITTLNDVHVQDAIFVPNNEIPNGTKLKEAIIKYGSLAVSYYGQSTYDESNPYYNETTYAQYVDKPLNANHAVSIVGWDDNFPKENFVITPPGDGAWIIKNSWGPGWGDNGFLYVSYYDQTLLKYDPAQTSSCAATVIFENTVPYNKNYQYALIGGANFMSGENNVSYMNVFEALDDDLIAGVGTYFNQEGVDYTVEIYVNEELKLTQKGVSPFFGYHTIKLDDYIPIKKGDVFKAIITSNAMPYIIQSDVRVDYTENISFFSIDGAPWSDSYKDGGAIVCLKVYTVADPHKENTFTSLENEIATAGNSLDLEIDYEFNNETDNITGILISKDNFILNGNGRTLDAKGQSRIFNITANNVTINDIVLINGNATNWGGIYSIKTLTLNNVTFINNYAKQQGGAVGLETDATLNINNSRFIDNYGLSGASIFINNGALNMCNTELTSDVYSKRGQIILKNATGYLENSTFSNIVSAYTPALFITNCKEVSIINSRFINLTANITAGAMAIKGGGRTYIKNCEFINTTSSKNAGAIIADIAGDRGYEGIVSIFDSVFVNTTSGFGGAYLQLGGELIINNSQFINGHATFNGGAVYISCVDHGEISNCNFTSNGVDTIEGYPTYGGAILCDSSTLNINNSNFINNDASAGSAVYAYGTTYNIQNSVFENNTNPIYTVFDEGDCLEKDNIYINDNNISTNNTFYATIMVGEGMELTLLNNSINVDTPPSRFDLRDWGWVSPVRDQGWMGACWTFGMTGTLESALLKAAGITTDFSENNMQNTMIRYSIYGSGAPEGGTNFLGVGYLLSWLGAFTQDADTYDELGKISPVMTTNQDIHIQDVKFIPNNEIPNGTQLKLAIMKYGSIDISYFGQSRYDEANPYYNETTYAQYVDKPLNANHEVSIVGWDDNFPKENFLITPPGDGAWIVKNSWGTGWGDNGYLYVSYYDKTLLQSIEIDTYATAIIIENTVPYNKNYQYDNFWGGDFKTGNGNVSYYNVFEALDDDYIAAVGTYFNQSGINYKVQIFVNDELKLTQNGVSPYYGYHTIKLNQYIPIKKGDVFKAVITSNSMPSLGFNDTRVQYTENISFVSFDGQTWQDCYGLRMIGCLKVYTVDEAGFTMFVEAEDIKVGEDAVITVTLTDDATGLILLQVGDVKTFEELENGKVIFTVSGLSAGEKNVTVQYLGDDKYDEAQNSTKFTVSKVDEYDITINATGDTDNTVVDVKLPNDASGNVTVTDKDGNNYTAPVENGEASVEVSGLPVGENNLTVSYSGDDKYEPAVQEVTTNTTAAIKETVLYGDKLEMIVGDGSKFTVTLTDKDGKPIAGKGIKLIIVGKTYTVKTDANGVAALPINLKVGSYPITAIFNGDAKYKASNAIVTSVEVYTNSRITENKDLVKTYGGSEKFTVRALDKYGKPVGAYAKVKMTIAGKTYTVNTDANGYASLPINLKVGTYQITTEYGGTTVTNKITVNKKQ